MSCLFCRVLFARLHDVVINAEALYAHWAIKYPISIQQQREALRHPLIQRREYGAQFSLNAKGESHLAANSLSLFVDRMLSFEILPGVAARNPSECLFRVDD